MANFNPEDGKSKVMPEGIYDAFIEKCEETTSKSSGKPMFKVGWKIVCGDTQRSLTSYILLDKESIWKLKKLCKALDMEAEYATGKIEAGDLVGKSCEVEVVIQTDDSGQYDDKNEIKNFRMGLGQPVTAAPAASNKAPKVNGKAVEDLAIPEEEVPF